MITIPILGALALGTGTVLEKLLLRKKKVGVKLYQTGSFLAISLLMLPLLYFFWRLDSGAFEIKNILIFLGVIASAVLANFFYLYSIKGEKITNTEPARILEPLLVILLAIIFNLFISGFSESNENIIIPAIIAGIAIIFPHIKKEHLHLNKYLVAALLGSFFFALELVVSNLILSLYSPITFYFLRCLFIFTISYILFKPQLKSLDKKIYLNIFLIGAIWITYRVAVYFGYLNYGIIFTTLITMTAPIIIYLLANKFLGEKLNWKNVLSSGIILACVAYVLLT